MNNISRWRVFTETRAFCHAQSELPFQNWRETPATHVNISYPQRLDTLTLNCYCHRSAPTRDGVFLPSQGKTLPAVRLRRTHPWEPAAAAHRQLHPLHCVQARFLALRLQTKPNVEAWMTTNLCLRTVGDASDLNYGHSASWKESNLSEKCKALTALSVCVGTRWNRRTQLSALWGSQAAFETESWGTAGPSEGLNTTHRSH